MTTTVRGPYQRVENGVLCTIPLNLEITLI